jgi:hypothetical protein
MRQLEAKKATCQSMNEPIEQIGCPANLNNTIVQSDTSNITISSISNEPINSYIPKTNMQIDKDTFLNTLLDGHRKFSERRKETTTGDEFDDKNLETVCRILGRMIAYELQSEE